MRPNVTAKVKVSTKQKQPDGQVWLGFVADYDDERNKEWAKYTPSLTLAMTVIPEVAEHFVPGQAYTLTFEPNDE